MENGNSLIDGLQADEGHCTYLDDVEIKMARDLVKSECQALGPPALGEGLKFAPGWSKEDGMSFYGSVVSDSHMHC